VILISLPNKCRLNPVYLTLDLLTHLHIHVIHHLQNLNHILWLSENFNGERIKFINSIFIYYILFCYQVICHLSLLWNISLKILMLV